ncbi:MAG TPA: hypothetical protein VMR73_00995 [Candidatus Paceibacterota bacterium]|nr:hypothetical protein [Candidatus Paceibacterota bacterium]
MEKVILDKNYNPSVIDNSVIYQDHLFETVDEIKNALDQGKINLPVANMLLQILITKEAKKESLELIQWARHNNQKTENTSVFINVSNNNKKYA